jgi:hypothetical protein
MLCLVGCLDAVRHLWYRTSRSISFIHVIEQLGIRLWQVAKSTAEEGQPNDAALAKPHVGQSTQEARFLEFPVPPKCRRALLAEHRVRCQRFAKRTGLRTHRRRSGECGESGLAVPVDGRM